MVATSVRGRHKRSVDSAKCSYRGGPYVDGLTSHKHRQPNPIPSNFRLQIEEFAGLSRAAPDAALLRRGPRMFRKQQKWSPPGQPAYIWTSKPTAKLGTAFKPRYGP